MGSPKQSCQARSALLFRDGGAEPQGVQGHEVRVCPRLRRWNQDLCPPPGSQDEFPSPPPTSCSAASAPPHRQAQAGDRETSEQVTREGGCDSSAFSCHLPEEGTCTSAWESGWGFGKEAVFARWGGGGRGILWWQKARFPHPSQQQKNPAWSPDTSEAVPFYPCRCT